MQGWQANKNGTCAQPVEDRAMPETEILPVYTGAIYLHLCSKYDIILISKEGEKGLIRIYVFKWRVS